jgi:ankyrin repeat protein
MSRNGGPPFKLSKAKRLRGFRGPKVPTEEDRRWAAEEGDDGDDRESVATTLPNQEQKKALADLADLQRSLNNAAKEDNAVGVDGCVKLQRGLDANLLATAVGGLDLGTPLCLAARRGNLAALGALLGQGADLEFVGATEKNGFRALHWAMSFNRAEAARLLIERGVDLHATTAGGDEPLSIGVGKGACEAVWELLRVDRCDKKNELGEMMPPSPQHVSCFHTAVLRGDVQMCRQFLKAGMHVDTPNHNGWAAVHIACLHNHQSLVALLANCAAKLNTSEAQTGMTPLVAAAKQGYVAIVSLLLDFGVELDGADSRGVTALQSACAQGRFDIINMLLESGASCDKRTDAGNTALMSAVKNNFQDITSRLLRHPGLDPESPGQRCPIGPGGVMWSPLQVAARCGYGSVVEVLWRLGRCDVNRQLRDENGLTWTPLSIASSRNHPDVVKILLRARARVFPINEDGRQALWFAARDGYSEVVVALLGGGGNAGMADVDGLTPALAAALHGHADTIKIILRWQILEAREDAAGTELRRAGGDFDDGSYDDDVGEEEEDFEEEMPLTARTKSEVVPESVSASDMLNGSLGPSPRCAHFHACLNGPPGATLID